MSTRTFTHMTTGGIPYALIEGYPKVGLDKENRITGEEQYIMHKSNVLLFMLEAKPPPVISGGSLISMQGRFMPGAPYLMTESVSFEPWSGDLPVNMGGYVFAGDSYVKVAIKYTTTTPEHDETDPESFLEHSLQLSGEYLTVEPTKTKIKKDGGVEGTPEGYPEDFEPNPDPLQPITKIIPTIEHTLTWPQVINVDWQQIFDTLGKVNSKKIGLFFDAEVETVLFMGVSGNQEYIWDGQEATIKPWKLDFKFTQRRIEENGNIYGWNHILSPKKQTWVRVQRGGADLYQQIDHSLMFRPKP